MTNELKPCPFCGGDAQRLKRDGKPTGMAAHCCYTLGKEIRTTEEAWNTRYERTCEVGIGKGEQIGWWVCNSCGCLFDTVRNLAAKKGAPPNFCPSCGAKVVGA